MLGQRHSSTDVFEMNFARPTPPLADELVRLDPLSRAFLEDMQGLGIDREVILHTYVEQPFGADDAIVWLARYIQGWQDGSCAGFAIVDAASDAFLGFCALVRIDREGLEAEIGYITAPAARGRGIATRSLVLISDWALTVGGLRRVELKIDHENPASQRVAERAGFTREGTLHSVHFKQGRRTDFHVYARIA
jgi:RimJ/RimL family protein N-acetyltransferase